MSVEGVIKNTFEQFGRGQSKAIAFSFDVSAASYEDSGSFRRRKSIHFLLFAPTARGSVRTFFAEDDNYFAQAKNIKLEDWCNISNHDICWVDAIRGKTARVYFEMCSAINQERLDARFGEVAPVSMTTTAHIQYFDRMFNILDVGFERDYEAEMTHAVTRWKVTGQSPQIGSVA